MSSEKSIGVGEAPEPATSSDDLLKTGPSANSELSETDLEGVAGGSGSPEHKLNTNFVKLK